MRIVAKRTGFYKVSMSTKNIIHVRYIINSKRTSIALLQYNNNNNIFILRGQHIWHECQSNIWFSITKVEMTLAIEHA